MKYSSYAYSKICKGELTHWNFNEVVSINMNQSNILGIFFPHALLAIQHLLFMRIPNFFF